MQPLFIIHPANYLTCLLQEDIMATTTPNVFRVKHFICFKHLNLLNFIKLCNPVDKVIISLMTKVSVQNGHVRNKYQ